MVKTNSELISTNSELIQKNRQFVFSNSDHVFSTSDGGASKNKKSVGDKAHRQLGRDVVPPMSVGFMLNARDVIYSGVLNMRSTDLMRFSGST